jgi:hypothetical protein
LLADLLKNKFNLSILQKIRSVQLLSNYFDPKTKSVVDDETLDKDKINQITIVYDLQDGNKPILD